MGGAAYCAGRQTTTNATHPAQYGVPPIAPYNAARLFLRPLRQVGRVQSTGLEHCGARTARLHRELDAEHVGGDGVPPQGLPVLDEHRARLVGVRAASVHADRLRVVEGDLQVAARVAVEVAGLQRQVGTGAPLRMVAEDQAHRTGGAFVGPDVVLRIDRRGDLRPATGLRLAL